MKDEEKYSDAFLSSIFYPLSSVSPPLPLSPSPRQAFAGNEITK
jgi:hypothetical protein